MNYLADGTADRLSYHSPENIDEYYNAIKKVLFSGVMQVVSHVSKERIDWLRNRGLLREVEIAAAISEPYTVSRKDLYRVANLSMEPWYTLVFYPSSRNVLSNPHKLLWQKLEAFWSRTLPFVQKREVGFSFSLGQYVTILQAALKALSKSEQNRWGK